jgi:hypothetical protein
VLLSELAGVRTMSSSSPSRSLSLARFVSRIEGRITCWITRHSSVRRAARFPHAEITWKCSQRTVWIATHSTEFLGMVEEHNGTYIANDTAGGTYNTYRTLAEAMEAFETPAAT